MGVRASPRLLHFRSANLHKSTDPSLVKARPRFRPRARDRDRDRRCDDSPTYGRSTSRGHLAMLESPFTRRMASRSAVAWVVPCVVGAQKDHSSGQAGGGSHESGCADGSAEAQLLECDPGSPEDRDPSKPHFDDRPIDATQPFSSFEPTASKEPGKRAPSSSAGSRPPGRRATDCSHASRRCRLRRKGR